MEIKYRGFEIIPNDFADGFANTPSDYAYLAHKGDGDPVYHWGSTVEAVKQSIDAELGEREAIEAEALHDAGEDCGAEKCQVCCVHDERDHGICLDCEHEEDPGEAIDRATDYYEGDR
jgi:hypothetical protein